MSAQAVISRANAGSVGSSDYGAYHEAAISTGDTKLRGWAIVAIITSAVLAISVGSYLGYLIAPPLSTALRDTIVSSQRIDAVANQDACQEEQERQEEELVQPTQGDDSIASFGSIVYDVMEFEGEWIASIIGELPENVSLPATVELSIPTGRVVTWIGAVCEETFDSDVYMSASANKRTEGEFDIYTIVLRRYRVMQIAYQLPEEAIKTVAGNPAVLAEYVPHRNVPTIWLNVTLPQGATLLSRATYREDANADGPVYGLVVDNALAGNKYEALFVYELGGE